jgi:deazaflavin-dependent oxidoreductase (nitroreductase family)
MPIPSGEAAWNKATAWLANVKAEPNVTVEVGAETFRARARVTHGAERRRLRDAHVAAIPTFGNYEKMPERELQVISLERMPGA